jgi:hypothetical protein
MSDFISELISRAADALACHEYRIDSDDWVPYCTCGWGAEEPYDVDAFDRHLVEVALLADVPDLLREAKAEAWDEGHLAGHEDARAVQPTYPQPTPNPYAERKDTP